MVQSVVPDQCDVLFHLASNTGVRATTNELQDQVNIRGTECIVNVCRSAKVKRLVLTSSIAVYFPDTHKYESYIPPVKRRVVLNESSPRSPEDFWVNYCRTKRIQEKIVLNADDVDVVVVQPSDIIGKYDDRSWGRLCQMMARCSLLGVPRTNMNFVDVQNVVDGHIRAALCGRTGECYILSGTSFSTTQLVEEMKKNIKRVTGVSPCVPYMIPLWMLSLLGYIQEWASGEEVYECNSPEALHTCPRETIFLLSSQHTASSEKAERELGYTPTSYNGVVSAIRQMVDCALAHIDALPEPPSTLGGRLRSQLLGQPRFIHSQ
eukprot:Sspe_Gene.85227::Locus_56021_Transcript_1_1_Confidence_1.000_Length_1625::g.85227::m.85227/K00091/E1.1.1.219; dihydroflavonol-4-reductase